MDVANQKIPILIVGATGLLGCAITGYALQVPNLQVNVLVQDLNKNPDLCSAVEAAGGKVLKADLGQPETLKDVTKGIHTVISVIRSADEKVSVEGQKALIDDCLKNGVKRFVPSEFAQDYSKFSKEELLISQEYAAKFKVNEYLKTTSLPLLIFRIGIFSHYLVQVLHEMNCYYGDTDLKHHVTSVENTARLVVAGVATAELTGTVHYSGGNYTIKDIQDIYNKARGTSVEIKRTGYIGNLRNEYEETKKAEGDGDKAKFIAMMMIFYDKRSKFLKLDNDTFPEVTPTSFEEFLQHSPDVKLEK